MYIKSVIIDGFKSYGRRTEIHGFDSEFTAITGLNGTGKSNMLDSICFVLGISNLGQVRAASLQDLVFKCGQAGVTKATVTLVFDNSDPSQCPIGYDKCRDISVTRQVIVGGRNKYMINGKNVQNKKVVDLFCSVQLNVNNPNFLIMQGRITKVLNMKPQEILSMIEEAAGTSMYETKKDATTKLIEKKDAKVRETNTLLKEEIEPKLEKLRQERSAYIEFQKICRDIEYLTRISISYRYLQQQKSLEAIEKQIANLINTIELNKRKILDNGNEMIKSEEAAKEIRNIIDNESGGQLLQLEEELSKKSSLEAKASGKIKAAQGTIDQEKKKINTLAKNIKGDEDLLKNKENQMANVGGLFQNLKQASENDATLFAEAQKKFDAVTQGLSTNEDGEASSLQDQIMTAEQQIIEAQTTIKKSDMELKHCRNTLKQKQSDVQTNDAAYLKDKKMYDNISLEIQKLTNDLAKMQYEEGTIEKLEERLAALTTEIRYLKQGLDQRNGYRYELQYRDPRPNFDRSKVRGMVGKLFSVEEQVFLLALTVCAGGSLYSYVTDDDVTSKDILKHGNLQRRITIIPINKINSSCLSNSVIQLAENLVGKDNVAAALHLVRYDPYFEPVMKFVFGSSFVCKDMNIAKNVTYHRNILSRSVTLEGDSVDPGGTLTGGSRPAGNNVLKDLAEIRDLEENMQKNTKEMNQINNNIKEIQNTAKTYHQIKERLELRQHELNACSQRLAQTTFQRNQQEIEDLKKKIETLGEDLISAREQQKTASAKVKDIGAKLADAKGYRERELKAATDAMKAAKKKSEESRKNWTKREQEYETLQLEIEDIKKGLTTSKTQFEEVTENLKKLEYEISEFKTNSKTISDEVSELKSKIKEQKDKINSQNKELKMHLSKKDKLNKQNEEFQLDIKKKENEVTKVKNDSKEALNRVSSLENKYGWIKEDREFFGTKNTRYDYSKEDPEEAGRKLIKMQEQKTKMERNINLKAMMLLDREEEQYKETMRRKKIVEDDKQKIQSIIFKMDEKKKEKVEKAWKIVDENFSSIFSTLLPGAQARLKPVYHSGNNLLGLEIRVGFNGMWKESLGELSGGQRSLVALSLVLAMLKFCPAPLYILDEVDAALDMSHTQNIGNMLKAHFRNSQFIIVSLKDGMFNNANVLFRTKFEEGVSAVTRTVNTKSRQK